MDDLELLDDLEACELGHRAALVQQSLSSRLAVVPFHQVDATRKRPVVKRDVKDEPTEDFDGEGLSDRSRSWSAKKL